MTNLQEQLERAWRQGLSVQLSPLLSGVAEWDGRVAIYVFSPDPRNKEPWRGDPCHVVDLGSTLAKTLDWIEARTP